MSTTENDSTNTTNFADTTTAADHWKVSNSVDINATPEHVYDLISDVTRTGEWSPTCKWCEWLGEAGKVGSRFKGHNETPERTWETESEVVAADRPHEFAWVVGPDAVEGGFVRWGYRVEEIDGGTRLHEDWDFHQPGLDAFFKKWGDRGASEAEKRRNSAIKGIPETLAAIKKVAESGK